MAKRGVPRLGNSSIRGDHLVHVSVVIPQRPSKEELKLVEELRNVTEKKSKTGIFGL
jgi:molecular chaperone DnaJ